MQHRGSSDMVVVRYCPRRRVNPHRKFDTGTHFVLLGRLISERETGDRWDHASRPVPSGRRNRFGIIHSCPTPKQPAHAKNNEDLLKLAGIRIAVTLQ